MTSGHKLEQGSFTIEECLFDECEKNKTVKKKTDQTVPHGAIRPALFLSKQFKISVETVLCLT